MIFQEQIESIMRENHLKHITALIDDEGNIRVRTYNSYPERYKRNAESIRERAREYYRKNRGKIRKYQREYYLRTRGKEAKKRVLNAPTYIPTPDDLAKAMAYAYSRSGMELKVDDLRATAVQMMQFFGFEREVVGNHLEHDEIAMMYQLEDLGLVDTGVEEYNLPDGNSWRVNYFILNARKIKEYSSMKVEENPSGISQVYQDLPEEAWVR